MGFQTIAWAVVGAVVAVSSPASAAVHRVEPGGGSGCVATISAAVTAAAPGDTMYVEHGTYHEDVTVTKSIYLVGEGRHNTIIDAAGVSNGIHVDGLVNPGLSTVVISGFTIKNAITEGILVANASDVSITDTRIVGNDRGLVNGSWMLAALDPA